MQVHLTAKLENLAHTIQKRQALRLSAKAKQKRGIEVTVRLISNFPRLWEQITSQTPKWQIYLNYSDMNKVE